MSPLTTPPPHAYQRVATEQPTLVRAYEALGAAAHGAGPLDAKTRELIKLGISIGAGLQSPVHAHVRLARECGVTPAEIRHVAFLATTTLGFPAMMRALAWVNDVLEPAAER